MIPDLLPEVNRIESIGKDTQIVFESGTTITIRHPERLERIAKPNTQDVPRLLLLSGLSESGKSTFGNYGLKSGKANRVKIYRVIANLQEKGKLEAIRLPLEEKAHGFVYDPFAVASLIGEHPDMQESAIRFIEDEFVQFHKQTDVMVDVVETVKHPWIIQGLGKSTNVNTISIFVEAPDELRISREANKLNISVEDVSRRIALKDLWKDRMGNQTVRQQADLLINNVGSREDYLKLVDGLLSYASNFVTTHTTTPLELS